jgi:Cu-Zn family superoxide dismutase
MQATGSTSPSAKHGTGTSAAGVTTGNATTGAKTSVATSSGGSASSSATASASDGSKTTTVAASSPAAGGHVGHGAVSIDQQTTPSAGNTGTSGRAGADTATATAVQAHGTPETSNTSDAKYSETRTAGGSGAAKSEDRSAAAATAAPTPAAAAPAADAQPAAAAAADEKAGAMATVKPAAGAPQDMQVSGTVQFTAAEHGVKVMVDLKGLKPNGQHGFHIHEKGDLSSPDLKSAGPHFNPNMKKHGGPEGDERHGGDLGNLTADAQGNAKVELMAHGVTLDGEKDGIVGRSILVHAKADDLKTDPSGDSGDRIAGGVITKNDGKSASAAPAAAPTDQPAVTAAPAAKQSQAGAAPTGQQELPELNK